MISYDQFYSAVPDPGYMIHVDWRELERQLEHYDEGHRKLNMNPDYQRGRVWSVDQQREYVEFKVSGGHGSDVISLNVPGLRGDNTPKVRDYEPYQCEVVDGVQRLNAVLDFKQDKFKIFGYYCSEFDKLPTRLVFIFRCNNLWTRRDVIRWYLGINSKGTPHSQEEIDRVRKLLETV